jgi:hypothetical protein
MISVMSGSICRGFVLARGKLGHETFTADERSLGLFDNQRAAIDAVINHRGGTSAPGCTTSHRE